MEIYGPIFGRLTQKGPESGQTFLKFGFSFKKPRFLYQYLLIHLIFFNNFAAGAFVKDAIINNFQKITCAAGIFCQRPSILVDLAENFCYEVATLVTLSSKNKTVCISNWDTGY
jgi:hypothetical protein